MFASSSSSSTSNHHDALFTSVLHGSTDVLEYILAEEGCDVDPINRIEGATPLHLAIKLEDRELSLAIVDSLLEAGADFKYAPRSLLSVLI